tara:strand:- start:372 stop:578 length:207 start_codon:yes stop_codon:yes gene_type:complete
MYNKGDLVAMVYPESDTKKDGRLIGLILEVTSWPQYEPDGVTDLYVHWSDGQTFWCSEEAVTLLANYL